MMNIPFHKPYMTDDEANAAAECIRNGWLTMGKITLDFEEKFREYVDASYAISVNSCTAALHLALCAIGLTREDEVIIPTTTFAATAEVVRYFDARPVAVDITRDTHCIDVKKIEAAITPRTKAIIPVHFAGQPCDMDEILFIARKHNLVVIEDAAHSLPALYKGRPVGQLGDITCFSFYATKTLSTGEGGMITTENSEWADLMKMLRLHGLTRDAWKRNTKEGSWRYDVNFAGFKYNLTDIASSIGLEQLKKCDLMTGMRSSIAAKYERAFSQSECLIPYIVKSDRISAWHLYPIKLHLERLTVSRDQFIELLKERGIVTSVHFIPLYHFKYYAPILGSSAQFPESEWVFNRVISLPIYPSMSDEETDYVIECVLDICKLHSRVC